MKDKIVFDLSGNNWQMEGIRPGEGVRLGFHQLPYDITGDAFNWAYAKVPGDVYTDLWRAGRIEDPHFGRNSMKAKWVPELEWWYKRQFDIPAEMRGKRIQLVLEGVDYACDVFFNGQLLGTQEGMFSIHKYDITDYVNFNTLRFGTNVLMIRLHPAPRRYSQVAGRKPAWHGDYWVSLPPTGIWKPVYIEATGDVTIENTYINSQIETKQAHLNVELELDNKDDQNHELIIDIAVQGANFKSEKITKQFTRTIPTGNNNINFTLSIEDPQLWYPWDLGDQNLYKALITITSSNQLLDQKETIFGIREIKMEMNPGFTTDQVENPWTVMINGKRHFMRSGTWGGPPDIFMGRAHPHKYKKLIELAKEANLNNLRIFGWHPTEIELFYQLCNEAGITVWQDVLPIASLSLPEEETFKQAVFNEAINVVKQIRNHPCLVILEGGEEIFMTAANRQHNLNFMLELGESIRPYHHLQYIPASPLSDDVSQSLGFKPNESYHANDLFYGEGEWVMETYFPSLDYAVIPELAISSCPNIESIKKFIPENEIWPPGPSWGHHWADFDVFRTLNYEVLGTQALGSLEEFVEATQVAQGAIFQYALEHFRRRKPKTSAVTICHYITFAPDMKWGIVDYYQEKKQSFFDVQRAFQPLLISLQFEKRRWLPDETFSAKVWIVNDYYDVFSNHQASIQLLDNRGNIIKEKKIAVEAIPKDSAFEIGDFTSEVTGKLGDQFYLELSLLNEKNEEVSANRYMLLVANQKEELEKIKAIGAEAMESKQKYGWANYYRYFPGLGGEDGIPEADELLPIARGFEPK
ncbi:MAG: sugar-binding domain-containing protein [Bacteroidota bacterium]